MLLLLLTTQVLEVLYESNIQRIISSQDGK
jgi:hypothetical protein